MFKVTICDIGKMNINMTDKIEKKEATFAVPYNGEDNNDYVYGKGFCCNDGSLEAAQARALSRAANNNFQESDAYEKMLFYYHPDLLGSSSYITNLDGEVVQHIEYVPFGEVFVEEHSSCEDLPYKFNGKQFDEETGLYYYGARYMNPITSLWYGVDPLAEKYVNIGSYIYCHSSPIMLIDPTGEGDYYAKNGSYLWTDKKNDNFIYIQYSSGKTKFEINGKYQNFQKLDVTRNTFLAFTSAINNESSGNKQESMALANVVMNFINDGGSKTLKTLDDVVLYRNSFMRGSN